MRDDERSLCPRECGRSNMETAGAYMFVHGLLVGHGGRLWVFLLIFLFTALLVVPSFCCVSVCLCHVGIRSVWVSMCCADIKLFKLGQGIRLYQTLKCYS